MYVFRSLHIIICLGYVLCGGSINSWLTSTKFEIQSVTKFVESAKTPLDPEQRIMYEFCKLRVELPEQQKNQSFSGTFYSSSSSTYIHMYNMVHFCMYLCVCMCCRDLRLGAEKRDNFFCGSAYFYAAYLQNKKGELTHTHIHTQFIHLFM